MNAQNTLRIEGVVIVDDGQCDDKARPHVVVRNSNEEWVALCEDEEQAAFIVRACNAHDELVAALRGTLLELAFRLTNNRDKDAAGIAAADRARAALAKAGAL